MRAAGGRLPLASHDAQVVIFSKIGISSRIFAELVAFEYFESVA